MLGGDRVPWGLLKQNHKLKHNQLFLLATYHHSVMAPSKAIGQVRVLALKLG